MAQPATRAEEHQKAQVSLAAASMRPLNQAWTLLDTADLERTLAQFRTAVEAITDRYGRASAALALRYFRQARRSAGVTGRITIPAAPPAPSGFIDSMVVDAVSPLVLPTPNEQASRTALDAQAEQMILDQGRRQVMSAVALDRNARGWARVTRPGACSFCLMLALRAGNGLLYKSRSTANFRAHHKLPNGTGGECRCSVEPVFGPYEAPAQVRQAQKVWDEATKGRSGRDAREAFRQAMEGRTVTGSSGRSRSKSGVTYAQPLGKTPETQRAQLKVLEAMPPAQSEKAAKWRADRIAEIRKYLGES